MSNGLDTREPFGETTDGRGPVTSLCSKGKISKRYCSIAAGSEVGAVLNVKAPNSECVRSLKLVKRMVGVDGSVDKSKTSPFGPIRESMRPDSGIAVNPRSE